MTQLLGKALYEIYKLPPDQQDAIATIILEELEDERKWIRLLPNRKTNSLNLLKSAC